MEQPNENMNPDHGVLGSDGYMPPPPMIGQMVIYRSKIGDGVCSPAVVLRTQDTTVSDIIDEWTPEPREVSSADGEHTHETAPRPDSVIADLPDRMTVDLLVHGLGEDYREYAVAHGDGPNTWCSREEFWSQTAEQVPA